LAHNISFHAQLAIEGRRYADRSRVTSPDAGDVCGHAREHDSAMDLNQAKTSGGVLIAAGAATLVVALVTIFWPDVTLLVLAILAGFNLLVLGIVGIVEGLSRGEGSRLFAAILGLLAVIAGIVLIRRPSESVLAFILVLGIWFVVSAVVSFVRAIFEPEARGVRMVVALVEFVFGILILALPKLSLGTLAVLCGIAFAVRGAGLIAAGLELRRMGEVPNGGIDTAAVAAEH
jgi:uncharacterized membrane protein HdeD (DUF308 family)